MGHLLKTVKKRNFGSVLVRAGPRAWSSSLQGDTLRERADCL